MRSSRAPTAAAGSPTRGDRPGPAAARASEPSLGRPRRPPPRPRRPSAVFACRWMWIASDGRSHDRSGRSAAGQVERDPVDVRPRELVEPDVGQAHQGQRGEEVLAELAIGDPRAPLAVGLEREGVDEDRPPARGTGRCRRCSPSASCRTRSPAAGSPGSAAPRP